MIGLVVMSSISLMVCAREVRSTNSMSGRPLAVESVRLLTQMASKGSVAVDGVSLTLVDVTDQRFSVALIPHTLSVTTLGQRQVGDRVNIETDVLAKYVHRQMDALRS